MIVTTQEGVPQEVPYQHIVTTTQQVMKYNSRTNVKSQSYTLTLSNMKINRLLPFCQIGHN